MLRFCLNSIFAFCSATSVFAQHQTFPPEQKLYDGRVEIILVGNKPCFYYEDNASISGKPSHFMALTVMTNNRMTWDINTVGQGPTSLQKPTSSSSCIFYGETWPQTKTTFPLNGIAKPLLSNTVYEAVIFTASLGMLSNYYSAFCIQSDKNGTLFLLQAKRDETADKLQCSKKVWK